MSSTVIEHVSVEAAARTGKMRTAAIVPTSDSVYRRTRLRVNVLTNDMDGVPQRFFTTS
jgi:hypothetical protein